MANVSGQGSNIPTMQRGTVPVTVQPSVGYNTVAPVSDAAGQGAWSLAKLLQGISNRIEDRLDVQAKAEGARAGTIAGMNGIPEQADEATIRGEAFNHAAHDAVQTQFELNGRLQISDAEQKNPANPTAFTNTVNGYLNGALPKLQSYDPAAAQQFEADYRLRAQDALNRIKDQQNAVIRDQSQERALRMQLQVQNDLAEQAQGLFTGDPATTKTRIAAMIANAGKLVDTAHQIGPDGRPLFTAEQRIATEKAALGMVGNNIGAAWMASQPSPIDAYHAWNNGNAVIRLGDGKGNVADVKMQDLLGPDIYASVKKTFIENLRSDLALQSQIENEQDHAFKKSSDTLFGDMSTAAQDGKLTLSMVEAAKTQLEPDKYTALRALAKSSGASVSDGATVARLTTADVGGADIRGQLEDAFKKGQLSQKDYLDLYQRNTDRLNKNGQDPVSQGRDYVGGSLGKLSTELGFGQAVSIPQAQAEYAIRIDDFRKDPKHPRDPTLQEAIEIGKDVVRRYSLTDVQSAIYSLPLPEFMSTSQKTDPNLKAADIIPIVQKTQAAFLQKYNGDAAKRDQDEEYRREMTLLKDYSDRLTLKDQQNAGSDNAK